MRQSCCNREKRTRLRVACSGAGPGTSVAGLRTTLCAARCTGTFWQWAMLVVKSQRRLGRCHAIGRGSSVLPLPPRQLPGEGIGYTPSARPGSELLAACRAVGVVVGGPSTFDGVDAPPAEGAPSLERELRAPGFAGRMLFRPLKSRPFVTKAGVSRNLALMQIWAKIGGTNTGLAAEAAKDRGLGEFGRLPEHLLPSERWGLEEGPQKRVCKQVVGNGPDEGAERGPHWRKQWARNAEAAVPQQDARSFNRPDRQSAHSPRRRMRTRRMGRRRKSRRRRCQVSPPETKGVAARRRHRSSSPLLSRIASAGAGVAEPQLDSLNRLLAATNGGESTAFLFDAWSGAVAAGQVRTTNDGDQDVCCAAVPVGSLAVQGVALWRICALCWRSTGNALVPHTGRVHVPERSWRSSDSGGSCPSGLCAARRRPPGLVRVPS